MRTTPPRSPLTAIVGASVAAVGASICCVVPLVLVLLGISGAWIATLTALDPWRPWFNVAALMALMLAFWNLYGPPSRCRTDGEFAKPYALKRWRRWLWVATVLIVLLLLFPYYVVWIL